MRREKLAVLMIIVLILLSAAPVLSSAQQTPYRIITVNEYGLVYVYDVLPAVGESTEISFPKNLIKNLVNYACLEDQSPKLRVGENFFSIEVNSKAGQQLHLITIFKNVLSWNPADQTFQLEMPIHPRVLGLKTTSFSVDVKLPRDAEISELSPGFLNQSEPGVISGTLKDVDFSKDEVQHLSIKFKTDSLKLIDIRSAKLSIELPDRIISLTLRLTQLGGTSMSEARLKFPSGFSLIEVKDSVGKLSSNYEKGSGELRVFLRQPVEIRQSTSFTVVLKASEESRLISSENGVSEIGLLLPMNSTIWIYEVEVVLRGGEAKSWSPEPLELRREYPEKTILVYRFDHVDPLNVKEMRITLNYEPSFTFFQVLPYLALFSIVLVVASLTIVYKPTVKLKAKKPGESLMEEARLLMLSYQSLVGLIAGRKIYDRSSARRTLLEIRSEVRRRVEKLGKLGAEVRREMPKTREEVESLMKAAKGFEQAVEKTWDEVYPYLSGSMPKKRLEKILDRRGRELKSTYEKVAMSLEALRRKLR